MSDVTITATGENTQLVSFSSLLTDLRTSLRSPSGAGSKWSDTELYLCLTLTLEALSGIVWVEDTWETEFVSAGRDYQLPAYVERIVKVERIGGNWVGIANSGNIDTGPPVPILGRSHHRMPHYNVLHFTQLHPVGATMRVTFLRRMQIPPQPVALSSNCDSDDTTIAVATPQSLPVPGYAKIDDEILYYTDIDGSNIKDCSRGELGTTAASHTAGAGKVDIMIPLDRRIHRVLLRGAEMEAYAMKLKDAPNGDTALSLTNYNNAMKDYHEGRKALAGGFGGVQVPNVYNTRRRRRPLL